jgi:alpha-tubulin suppressor-like RCC1 family protein
MADRFPGGVISKTPPTVVAPVDGEGGSASGVWTLDEVLGYEKAGAWPKGLLPRELYAWGLNSNGKFGDGTASGYRSSPTQVGTSTNWEAVFAGNDSTAAIRTGGSLWVWGRNNSGQLGQNDLVDRSSPVQVGALTNWTKEVGWNDKVLGVIKTDGTLWTWGEAGFGQTGRNDQVNRSSPVQLGALTWAKISRGDSNGHFLAITTGGALYAWGNGSSGQLGNGVGGFPAGLRSSPVQVGALTTWASVATASNQSFAVKNDGTLWAFGNRGVNGYLGDNIADNSGVSSPIQVGALTNWSLVNARGQGTAAVKTDGTFWVWGRNNDGDLGQNNTINRSSPVQVGSQTNWSLQFSTSYRQAIAIKTDGTIWSWGQNNSGQLGQNDLVFRSSPVQIGADSNWATISMENRTVLATTKG